MKKLSDLLESSLDIDVYGIVDDSRLVKKGYMFVATNGFNVDHYDFINDAIKNGCSVIISDREYDCDVPVIIVDDINNKYIDLCIKYYDVDLDKIKFIGITGTDGKTTTASIVQKLLYDCAYIGTNGLIIGNEQYSTSNTTPCISELYNNLCKIQNSNISDVVMEVSSEALLHNRVDNLKYDIACFTNITGDHLNVHGNFDNYLKSKLKLLKLLKKDSIVVVNGDDLHLQNIKCKRMYKVGCSNSNDFVISDVKSVSNRASFSVKYKKSVYKITSPFIGMHNVYNVTFAFVICLLYGIDANILINKISKLSAISGRCEFLDFGQDYDIVLDYAHTINGIKNILDTFSDYEKIITITGCAGGRDSSKRSLVGELVMSKSDVSIFTMDDPRNEDVNKIIDDMVSDSLNYIRITDRKAAINYGLSIASRGSVVLILGKGRDNYMAIGDEKIPYSDYNVVMEYFS